ncbi:hypothetical protein KEJ27_10500 [Candidatus Bathyarchaeota archaeon]|nr:hypothetical protein [Candidatus Bathyarchaeota archaeon]
MVDTAATFTKILSWAVQRAGIEGKYTVEIELADGRIIRRKAGLAEVEIENVGRPALVTFSDGEERPLTGVTTLEVLGLRVNLVIRKLEKVRAVGY